MAKPTILIVDDDKAFTDKFVEFLNIAFDCTVIVRNDSNGAAYVVKDEHVDILFQDIHVPGPDGFEIVKILKEFKLDAVKVFIITSWKEDAYIKKCAELGVEYLPKPIGYKLLQKSLVDIFDKKGLEYKKK